MAPFGALGWVLGASSVAIPGKSTLATIRFQKAKKPFFICVFCYYETVMNIWNTIFIEPLHNALLFLVQVLPGENLALAIIGLTVIVKLILLPLSRKSIINQIHQKRLQPYVKKLREKYTDKQEQAQKLMEFYKANKTNPFSGCLLILVQLPIILALYRTFLNGVNTAETALYAGVQVPENLQTVFAAGLIDLEKPSIILAVATGLVQLVQVLLSPSFRETEEEKAASKETKKMTEMTDPAEMQAAMMKKVQKGMRFLVPVMITFFGTVVPAAVTLYWMTTNLFTIVQELVLAKRLANLPVVVTEEE